MKDYQELYLIDLDKESINYLRARYPHISDKTYYGDYLQHPIDFIKTTSYSIIGNFPYNISSQIFFKILENKDRVNSVVGMLQLEVAKRLASAPGNKNYGILSVLLQAYYDIEYLFDVPAEVFNPPPKVTSGVIRLIRNNVKKLPCDEVLFKTVVKQGFQNRRKTLRNALKPLNLPTEISIMKLLDKRAEALSVADFTFLTQKIAQWKN